VRQPYGENGGPGGLAHTLRQVPETLAIARDMERLCPDAWLINFTNPVPRLCLAVNRHSRIKSVGLCHQINIAYMMIGVALAERLGIDVPTAVSRNAHPDIWPKANCVADQVKPLVDIKAAGLNRFTWILSLWDKRSGDDSYPAFRQELLQLPAGFEPLIRPVFQATARVQWPSTCPGATIPKPGPGKSKSSTSTIGSEPATSATSSGGPSLPWQRAKLPWTI